MTAKAVRVYFIEVRVQEGPNLDARFLEMVSAGKDVETVADELRDSIVMEVYAAEHLRLMETFHADVVHDPDWHKRKRKGRKERKKGKKK